MPARSVVSHPIDFSTGDSAVSTGPAGLLVNNPQVLHSCGNRFSGPLSSGVRRVEVLDSLVDLVELSDHIVLAVHATDETFAPAAAATAASPLPASE